MPTTQSPAPQEDASCKGPHLQTATPDRAAPEQSIRCSVVVLTLNEQINIGACLQSLSSFDDVHVLDSGSTDETIAVARLHRATVSRQAFTSFGQQRNHAHDQLPLRHDWVLHLDADERMTPALESEIRRVLSDDPQQVAGFFLAERTLLDGRWLRHAGQYPRYQARLVHRRRMRFVDHGHGQREQSDGPMAFLAEPYDHHAFSHGMEHWLRKHAGYAMREAQAFEADPRNLVSTVATALRSKGVERRRAVKQLAGRLPLRPLLRHLHVLVLSGGILDGRAGWQYARMMATFQHMIDLCSQELRHRSASLTAGGNR